MQPSTQPAAPSPSPTPPDSSPSSHPLRPASLRLHAAASGVRSPSLALAGAGGGSAGSSRFDEAHAESEATFWAEAGAPSLAQPVSAVSTPMLHSGAHTPGSAGGGGERDSERSRRRIAAKRKAGVKRWPGVGSAASSPQQSPMASGSASPVLMYHMSSPNDAAGLHPSLQHQLHGQRASSGGSLSRPTHFAQHSASGMPSGSPQPSGTRSAGGGSQSHGRRANGQPPPRLDDGDGTHRIDIPSAVDPDDPDLDVIDRVQSSFWRRVQDMDPAQRTSTLHTLAMVHGAAGLAFLLTAASTLITVYANPAVHWSGVGLGVLTLGLSWLLRSAAPTLDAHNMLLFLVFSGFDVTFLLVLSILCFHSDAMGQDVALRAEWNRLDADTKLERFHAHFPEMQAWCMRNLAVLGIASMMLAIVVVVLMCMVLAVRTHLISEQQYAYDSLARTNQFQERLHNRQRLARLGAQMKERRRLRKQRGRSGSHVAGMFTGLGSQGSGSGGSGGGGGGLQRGVSDSSAVEMSDLRSGSPALPQSSTPQLDADARAERFAGMLSEDIEAELERDEQRREVAAAARAAARG